MIPEKLEKLNNAEYKRSPSMMTCLRKESADREVGFVEAADDSVCQCEACVAAEEVRRLIPRIAIAQGPELLELEDKLAALSSRISNRAA